MINAPRGEVASSAKWVGSVLMRAVRAVGGGRRARSSERLMHREQPVEALELRRMLSGNQEFSPVSGTAPLYQMQNPRRCMCPYCTGMVNPAVVQDLVASVTSRGLPTAGVAAPTVIDMLAVYTPSALSLARNEADLITRTTDSVNFLNLALYNTGVNLTVRLVGLEEVAFTESPDTMTSFGIVKDLAHLRTQGDGVLDEVTEPGTGLRDTYGADLVTLIGNYAAGGGIIGIAAGIGGNQNFGFNINDFSNNSFGYSTLAHETGHNLGARHSRATAVRNGEDLSGGRFSYSYGYELDLGNTTLIDTMSYESAGGVYVPYFANPAVTVAGQPFGVPVGQPNEADLARTFDVTGPAVAAFRPVGVMDAAPRAGIWQKSQQGSELRVTLQYFDDISVGRGTFNVNDIEVRDGVGTLLTVTGVSIERDTDSSVNYVRYTVDVAGTSGNPLDFDVSVVAGEVFDSGGNSVAAGTVGGIEGDWEGGSPFTNDLGIARDITENGAIRIRSSVDGTLTDAQDYYRIEVPLADSYTFSLSGVTRFTSLSLVWDEDLNYKTDAGETLDSIVVGPSGTDSFTLSLDPGVYYLRVTTNSPGAPSEYTLGATISAVVPDPIADAGGSYTVAEGGTINLDASASVGGDTFGVVALVEWDFDYVEGGAFTVDATGFSPVFSAGSLDGFVTKTVGVRVTNQFGRSDIATAAVDITNAAPTVNFVPTAISELGGIITVTGVTDSPGDIAAGFLFAFDLNNDGLFEVAESTSASVNIDPSLIADGPGLVNIRVSVKDKDNAVTVVSVGVPVTNVAPTGDLALPATLAEGQAGQVQVASVVDSAADLAAGILYSFDFDNDGTFEIVDSTSAVAAIPLSLLEGPSTLNVTVRLKDKDGGENLLNGSVAVTNTAPTATLTLPGMIDLFTPTLLTSSATDPSAGDTAAGFTYAWIARRGGLAVASNATANWNFTTTVPGDYEFTLTVTDRNGGSTSVSQTVTADQLVKPTLSVTPVGAVREGEFAEYLLSLSGVSVAPVVVDFAYSVAGGASIEGGAGSRRVTLAVGQLSTLVRIRTLDNTARSTTSAVTLTLTSVTGAQLSTQPVGTVSLLDDDTLVTENPVRANRSLTVSGSDFADDVRIEPGTRGRVRVITNGVLAGEFLQPRRITLDLLGGDDKLTVDRRVRVPLMVFGGSGNDSLVGGNARDILIGGDGSDALSGGNADNLLITGSTAYGASSAEADTLFSVWNGRGGSAQRIRTLTAEGGVLFGSQVIADSFVDRVDVRKADSVLRTADDEVWGARPVADLFT